MTTFDPLRKVDRIRLRRWLQGEVALGKDRVEIAPQIVESFLDAIELGLSHDDITREDRRAGNAIVRAYAGAARRATVSSQVEEAR